MEEERRDFELLMDKIGWFMFDFLVLGYIQNQQTGASFSVPVTENWKIFIEVQYGVIIVNNYYVYYNRFHQYLMNPKRISLYLRILFQYFISLELLSLLILVDAM